MKLSLKIVLIAVLLMVALLASQTMPASAAPKSAIAAPAITAPANGASIVESQQPVTFSWQAAANASYYRFQISTTSDFATASLLVNDGGVKDVNFASPVTLGVGTYYWRVRGGASDGSGGYITGEWSAVYTLNMVAAASVGLPALAAPANGAAIDAAQQPVVFSWNAAPGASYYRFQLATSADFADTALLVNDGSVNDVLFASPVTLSAGTYYWRVRGGMSDGNGGYISGEWSEIRSLSISNPAPTVGGTTLAAPGNAASVSQQPVLFSWNAAPGASYYRFQLSKTADFANISLVVNDGSVTTINGYNPNVTLSAATYYWRVRGGASDGNGGYISGEWSEIRSLTFAATTQNALPYYAQRPYSSTSIWNTPIPSSPRLDPNSSTMIGRLGSTSTGGKIYSDTTQYTYPVYFADASTRRIDVPCVRYKCTVVSSSGTVTRVATLTGVPIPRNAQVSGGSDAQMIVIDTTNGMEYGFYHGRWTSSGGYETDGGYQYNVNYNGTPVPFGSRGAGVTYYAGLIRPWEIRQGRIDHALAFAYDIPRSGRCVYPATQTDGTSTDRYALPEGARLQLNPALTDADFDRMGLSPAGKIVARALQKYGMFVIDTGGSPKIMAENLSVNPLTTESWDSLGYTKDVIAGLPYQQFRVLDLPDAYWGTSTTTNYGSCFK